MKSRTFFSAIALVAGLLLLIGIAGFWRLTADNPQVLLSEGGQTAPSAAQFVPRQAPLMVSLLSRPDRLWTLRQQLTSPGGRLEARQEWQVLQQLLNNAIGWDYDIDVRPWLDEEITLAVTSADLDHDRTNGQQAGYLVVLGCKDGQKAREAIHVLWQNRVTSGRTLVFETVSGIPLVYDQKPLIPVLANRQNSQESLMLESLASAVVADRYVLLANNPNVLHQAITTFQAPDVSLAKMPSYRTSINTLPSSRIGWLYANAPTLLTWLGLEEPQSTRSFLDLHGRRAHQLFMSLRPTSSGLLGDIEIASAPGTRFNPHDVTALFPNPMLQLLPAETTLLATTGQYLSDWLSETTTSIGGYRVTQRSRDALLATLPTSLSDQLSELTTSFPSSFALGLLAEDPLTWVLATQGSSQSQTPSFYTMDGLAQQNGLNVSHVMLGDIDVTTWTRLSIAFEPSGSPAILATEVVGVHALISGYDVFSTSLSGLQQIMQTQAESSLLNDSVLMDIVEDFDKPYGTLMYIDWDHLLPLIRERFPWLRLIEQAANPIVRHLGPVVVSGYGSSQSLQEGVVAIKLLENHQGHR